jgi:superfamily II DNA or RNA helicase
MKVLLTHKGIIFDENSIISAIGRGALAHLKSKLTITHTIRIGNKMTQDKKMFLFKTAQVGERNLFITSRQSNPVKELYKYTLNLKDGANRADKFLESVEYINKVPPGHALPLPQSPNESGIILHNDQKKLVDHLIQYVYNDEKRKLGQAGCVIYVGTGVGKSYLGTYLANYFGGKTAFILPNTAQLFDWKQIFAKHYPHIRIGEYHSKTKCDGDFVLFVKNSSVLDEFVFDDGRVITWQDYTVQFRTVIYDEIHKYPTGTFSEMFWRFGCQNMIGLSATPNERNDPFDIVYQKHVGDLVSMEDIEITDSADDADGTDSVDDADNIPWTAKVRVIRYHGSPEYTKVLTGANGWMHAGKMAQQFCQDPNRTKLILNLITEMYAQGRNIFIFAENRAALTALRKSLTTSLTDIQLEVPEDTGIYELMGGISEDDKNKATQSGRVILITYAFGSDQISILQMDTIILATSRMSQITQVIGRIFRRGGDKSIERIIVDIVDEETKIKKHHASRLKCYQKSQYNIKILPSEHVHYNEITV